MDGLKYYFIEIVRVNGEEARAIFMKDNFDEAQKAFHNTLAYNINLDGCERVVAVIMSDDGSIIRNEMWERKIGELNG